MKISRFDWDGKDPRGFAAELRELQPPPGSVAEDVAAIIAEVQARGDAAVVEISSRFGEVARELRIPEQQISNAAQRLSAELTDALESAARNVRAVAEAQLAGEVSVTLEQGQSVRLRTVPVGAAGVYAPGGTAAYPSSVLMGCVPAKVAGVDRVAVVTPPNPGGEVEDLLLAAAEIGGADEVYAAGGPQAVAALALGTESIEPVDVIAGPGNRYVQEAKRQLFGRVGIDGIAGPSELMVIFDRGEEAGWLALDLCAQAEHGPDGLLVAASSSKGALRALRGGLDNALTGSETVSDAPLALVKTPSLDDAGELANALAPEHLELAGGEASELSKRMRTAGCVFVGARAATAFGDYAAGSNHVLPTGGAGRFQGPLGPGVFRRSVSTVTIPGEAAAELAPTVATLARAEGFPVHAESAEARVEEE